MCHKSCGSRKQVTGNGFRRCACGGVMLYVSGAGKLCRMGKGGWSLFYRHPGLDPGSLSRMRLKDDFLHGERDSESSSK